MNWYLKSLFVSLVILFVSCNNKPNPYVVSSANNIDPSVVAVGGMALSYKEAVDVQVKNKGGKGTVMVSCAVSQGSKSYNQTKTIFMESDERIDLHFVFDEPSRPSIGGNISHKVEVIAFEE